MVEQFTEQFKQKLGEGWLVHSKHVHLQVYYFICSKGNYHILTGSYGIYDETDFEKIIKKEVELVKIKYRQFQQVNGVTS